MSAGTVNETDRLRFEAKHTPEPNTGCWLWLASSDAQGYGYFGLWGKIHRAHRASYLLHAGPIPDGLLVLHRCDVPGCVNPDHLFLGSQRDNVHDMARKGRDRKAFGEGHGRSKLTEADVLAIRADNRSGKKIAGDYNISPVQANRIKAGTAWSQL